VFLGLEVGSVLLFALLAFGVPVRGSLLALTLIVLLGAMAFSGVGLLVASRSKTVEGVSGLMNLVMVPMWICSGVFFLVVELPRRGPARHPRATAHRAERRATGGHDRRRAARAHRGTARDRRGLGGRQLRARAPHLPLAMKLLKPAALKTGARVALVAPAGPLSPERIEASVARCLSLGLDPIVYPAATARHRFLAGTDAERLATYSPRSTTFRSTRSGRCAAATARRASSTGSTWSGSVRSRSRSSASATTRPSTCDTPRWAWCRSTGRTRRGLSARNRGSFRRVLFHDEPAGRLPAARGEPEARTLVGGRVEAPLVGGNLALIASLCGTEWGLAARGHILFLEDIGEPAYRVDRMLGQLHHAA
jgi:hypothetical protein